MRKKVKIATRDAKTGDLKLCDGLIEMSDVSSAQQMDAPVGWADDEILLRGPCISFIMKNGRELIVRGVVDDFVGL